MSNDMPDVIWYGIGGEGSRQWFGVNDGDMEINAPRKSKYYSESHVQQIIKEAEERQLELSEMLESLISAVEHNSGFEPSISLLQRTIDEARAILNAGGE